MAEKTEQPTPKRLREARQKGQIPKSQDLTQAFGFIAGAAILSSMGPEYVSRLKGLMTDSFQPALLTGRVEGSALLQHFGDAWVRFLLLSLPLLVSLALTAGSLTFLQTGAMFTPPKFSFDKLNPMKGLQNIFFSPKSYIELAKTILKFTIISYLAWTTVRGRLPEVLLAARIGLPEAAALGASLMSSLLFKIGGTFVLFGAADYLLQRKMIMQQLMMSKEEITREYKQDEGDPHIKHQRQHLHREMLNHNVAGAVKKAKVVVVNPTHLAIALEYDDAVMPAPLISMKGQDSMALRMIDFAKEYDVPIMRNIPLAHSLITVDIGAEIPEELYEPVAEVLNWVYELSEME